MKAQKRTRCRPIVVASCLDTRPQDRPTIVRNASEAVRSVRTSQLKLNVFHRIICSIPKREANFSFGEGNWAISSY